MRRRRSPGAWPARPRAARSSSAAASTERPAPDWQFEALPAIDIPAELDGAAPLDDETDPGVRRARVYRVRGAKARAQRLRERGGPRGTLLGRDLELKAMRDLYRDVVLTRSKRQLTLVGEAGVGKRTLVSTFLGGLPPGEAVVVRATTRIATAMTPFGIVADMARDLLGLAEDAEPHEVERRLLRALPLIFPNVSASAEHDREARGALEMFGMLLGARPAAAGPGNPAIDADERRARLLQLMLRIERQLAPDRPLVLIGEDVHWADEQSQQLFADLLKVTTDRPILGVLTTRPDATVIARAREAGAQIVHLHELPLEVAERMVAERFAPDDDAAALIAQIAERSGGNPAFIGEIVETLLERGVIAEDEDGPHAGLARWQKRGVAVEVPSSIEDAIATRFDALRPALRDVVLHAAVLGRGFAASEVAMVLDRPARLELDELVARGLLHSGLATDAGDEYRFKSDVAMGVAYRMLEPARRRRLHERTASRLGAAASYRPGQDDAAIARHLELAGDTTRAAERYLRAAAHAVSVGGNADALRQLTRALRLLPTSDHGRRFTAHAERAEILRRLGRRQPQLRELHAMRREAESLGDVGKQARAHATLAQFYIDIGRAPAAARASGPALQFARTSGDPLAEAEALRLRAVIARLLGKHDEALRHVADALALADGAQTQAARAGGGPAAEAPRAAGAGRRARGPRRDAVGPRRARARARGLRRGAGDLSRAGAGRGSRPARSPGWAWCSRRSASTRRRSPTSSAAWRSIRDSAIAPGWPASWPTSASVTPTSATARAPRATWPRPSRWPIRPATCPPAPPPRSRSARPAWPAVKPPPPSNVSSAAGCMPAPAATATRRSARSSTWRWRSCAPGSRRRGRWSWRARPPSWRPRCRCRSA
jgi:tetratricopeptide (TPR) repeat protein